MRSLTRLSIQELIVLAAAGMFAPEFTEAELTVRAWELDPKRFGLRGYWQSHPDSKKVSASIAHQDGPVKRGYLVRVRPCVLAITEQGRALAEATRGRIRRMAS